MPFKPYVKEIKPYVAQAPVERLQAELGFTLVYVTHSSAEAAHLGSRVILMG